MERSVRWACVGRRAHSAPLSCRHQMLWLDRRPRTWACYDCRQGGAARPHQWDLEIGVRYPAHSTALEKVLLANLPDKELTDLFEKNALSKGAGQADSQLTGFRVKLATCKKQGYAMSVGGLFVGVRVVAAPIFDSLGQVRAAVSATSNAGQHSAGDVIPYVTRIAKEISMRLVAGESIKLPRNGE